jgi:glycosyltransferase involved in cell wall biosynthesis
MRIVIDLQAAQTESRVRGIGRYSLSLAQAMAREAAVRGHDVRLLLSEKFPDTVAPLRQAFGGLVPQDRISIFSAPATVAEMHPANAWRARAAEQVREQFIAAMNPDVVHVASLFEGWLDDAVTSVHASTAGLPTAVTLYDLIPFVLQDIYLQDQGYKRYYLNKLESLKRSDLLLAISDYSRDEAIGQLGIAAERVVNISAGIDSSIRPQNLSVEATAALLTKYGISRSFVLYVPGGFDPRKNFDRLIESFARLPAPLRKQHQLVIGSKVPEGMREELVAKAARLGLKADELILTDYVPDHELLGLYCLCKLSVFPSLYEGFGLPALEAMACGAPVIASNTTSLPEVIGWADALFDPESVESMSALMSRGLKSQGYQKSLREHSLQQANRFSWEHSAQLAIDAFEQKFERPRARSNKVAPAPARSVKQLVRSVITRLEKVGTTVSPTPGDLALLSQSLETNHPPPASKQLLIDISELVNRDAKSGIQRVVRSILLQLLNNPPKGYRVEPVYSETGSSGLRYARQFTARFLGRHPVAGDNTPISFSKGDVYVGLDLTAHLFPGIDITLQQMRSAGVKIHYVVYDLTPLLTAKWHSAGMTIAFTGWIAALTEYADGFVCISNAVADDLRAWLKRHPAKPARKVAINYFHLGADIQNSQPSKGLPKDAKRVLKKLAQAQSFLMVGTVEPRKGYAQALDTFDDLWAKGEPFNLVIVGKAGWNVDALIDRLRTHPEMNSRLHWLEGISDEYLENIYGASTVLLATSEAEGFGLPLIEAAQHGLPIIARGLPVFREVAGKHAFYFNGVGRRTLKKAIHTWIDAHAKGKAPTTQGMSWLTWAESANQLVKKILPRAPKK